MIMANLHKHIPKRRECVKNGDDGNDELHAAPFKILSVILNKVLNLSSKHLIKRGLFYFYFYLIVKSLCEKSLRTVKTLSSTVSKTDVDNPLIIGCEPNSPDLARSRSQELSHLNICKINESINST